MASIIGAVARTSNSVFFDWPQKKERKWREPPENKAKIAGEAKERSSKRRRQREV